jgi:hypothetical protein
MQIAYAKVMFISVVSLILCFNSSSFAQNSEPSAHKFDESGDIYPTDMAARLDNFAIALQNSPSARAFLLVYRSHRDLPGLSGRHVNWMRGYLIYSRGIRADSIVAIDGGTASCLSHELWIVPSGTVPKPRADAYSRGAIDAEVARKHDEYHYTVPEDMLEPFSTEYENELE